jgi:transcriptional regulator with XRE-family HTH domain
MDGERFGRRVRAFRKLKRIPQAELARRLNLSTSFLGRIERGEKTPDIEMLEKIAEQLEINIQELIGDFTEKEGHV